MSSAPSHFQDPEFAQRYIRGPGQFVPGYEVMHRIVGQLLAELGSELNVLVIGAGGGLETEALACAHERWRFVCVDPALPMIEVGKQRLEAAGVADRASWIHGVVADAPVGPFDAATCLLTLHFVSDDGGKLATLNAIRDRLKPRGRLALVDLCVDMDGGGRELYLERYRDFALNSGAEPDDVARTVQRLRDVLKLVPAVRDEELLNEAGFANVDLVYAGLSWRGWIADVP